jgi:hypothetical protein
LIILDLGGEDMMNTKRRGGILIPDLAGMRAWFTLQHYKKLNLRGIWVKDNMIL